MDQIARYPPFVLVSTWLFLPVSAWSIFVLFGLQGEWWAWAAFGAACIGVGTFLASPWSIEWQSEVLVVRRVWRRPEVFELTKLTWSLGRPSLINHLVSGDSITASDGRSFLVFPSSLSNYDELRKRLGVPPG